MSTKQTTVTPSKSSGSSRQTLIGEYRNQGKLTTTSAKPATKSPAPKSTSGK